MTEPTETVPLPVFLEVRVRAHRVDQPEGFSARAMIPLAGATFAENPRDGVVTVLLANGEEWNLWDTYEELRDRMRRI